MLANTFTHDCIQYIDGELELCLQLVYTALKWQSVFVVCHSQTLCVLGLRSLEYEDMKTHSVKNT